MLIIDYSIQTTAQPAQIWRLYEDVSQWSRWDSEIIKVHLPQGLKEGADGVLTLKGNQDVKFHVDHVDRYKSFSDTSFLPFTKLIFTHTIEDKGNFRIVRHQVVMKGWLAPFFAFIVGRKIKKNLPGAMGRLKELAEKS